MNLADESVRNLLKLVSIIFGKKGLFLVDLCKFSFIFGFVILQFFIVKFHRYPFLVMDGLSHDFFYVRIDDNFLFEVVVNTVDFIFSLKKVDLLVFGCFINQFWLNGLLG
jgi:hypothetical protein